MRFLTRLRRWHVVAIVAVILVVAVGAFLLSRGSSNQDNANIEEDQQVIPVRRGDLIQEISITGSLSLPNRETLTFGSSGVIAEIMVEEGGKVSAGQTLATLDQEDIAALEEEVIQARVTLRDAEEALEDYMSPSELDIARARKDVTDAEVRLQDSRDALEDFVEPSGASISQIKARIVGYEVELDKIAEDIENLQESPTQLQIDQAKKNVASARLELERTQDNLEEIRESPTQLQIDQAKKNVASARLELERAEKALEEALAGPDLIDIESAYNNLDAAEREFSNAKSDLDLVGSDWEERLDDARKDMDDRAEAYAEVFSRWLGVYGPTGVFHPEYEIALSDLGVNLETVFDLSRRFSDLEEGGYYSDGLPVDDPSTIWNDSTVFMWLNLSPTDLVVMCDPGDTPLRGVCIQEEFRASSKLYISARDNLADLEAQADKSLSSAKTAEERALNALNVAEKTLEDLTKPVEPTEIADMEAAVQLAKSALADAEKGLQELTEPKEAAIGDLTAAVQLAKSALADAEKDLQELLNPEDVSLSIRNLEAQAELARANLQQAQDDLEELLSGKERPEHTSLLEDIEVVRLDLEDKLKDLQDLIEPDPESLGMAVLQVNVASAKVALSQAEQRLADATIAAPFDGFVSELDVEEGDEVERHTNIVVVVDTSVVELDGSVDEIDVLETHVGAKASVEVDALPDQEIVGEVSSIAVEPNSGQGQPGGIVTYPVTIRLTVPKGVDLPSGLSAVASITISEERDVLLVPLDALRGPFDKPTLHVMTDGEIVETPVTLGNSDDFLTVVTSGVEEGDMIITIAPEESEGEFDVTSGPG